MSDNEEPPAKLSKMDNTDDDNTDASFDEEPVTGCINMPEITDLSENTDLPLPAINLQEVTNLRAGLPEGSEAPQNGITDLPALDMQEGKVTHIPELGDLPEIVNLPDISNLPEIGLPELSSIPEVSAASETAEISLPMQEGVAVPEGDTTAPESDTAGMVEERLQDSMSSQDQYIQQEEWLSEGVLTDEDYNTSAEGSKLDATASNTNGVSEPAEMERGNEDTKQNDSKPIEQNIEDALNSLDGGMVGYEEYLVEKKEVKTEPTNLKTENDKEVDDGNDTDDLLRMLGGDDSKTKKKLTKTVKDLRNVKSDMSSSEDEFEVQQASAKKLKLAKALIKKDSPKPVHEESDDTSDDTAIMKKMLTKRSGTHAQDARSRLLQGQTKASLNTVTKAKKDKLATSTPVRPPVTRSLLKPGVSTQRAGAQPKTNQTSVEVKREPNPNTYSRVKKTPSKKSLATSPRMREEREDLDDEYHLNEEESDFEEDPLSLPRKSSLKTEEMEAEVLSDGDSHSEDGSLYDELPSSDSDDIDDWFQLDIRAEKAGDYLPLLGTNAKEVLLEERDRVAERLINLKKSLSALTESGKKQADQVRSATLTLAELDDMLKAA